MCHPPCEPSQDRLAIRSDPHREASRPRLRLLESIEGQVRLTRRVPGAVQFLPRRGEPVSPSDDFSVSGSKPTGAEWRPRAASSASSYVRRPRRTWSFGFEQITRTRAANTNSIMRSTANDAKLRQMTLSQKTLPMAFIISGIAYAALCKLSSEILITIRGGHGIDRVTAVSRPRLCFRSTCPAILNTSGAGFDDLPELSRSRWRSPRPNSPASMPDSSSRHIYSFAVLRCARTER